MPVKRKALAEREVRSVRIDFGDAGDLNVEFFPGKLTFALQKRINQAAQADDYETLLESFLVIFAGWDLLDEDGEPEPLTMAVFEDLGLDVLAEVMGAVRESIAPKAETPTS